MTRFSDAAPDAAGASCSPYLEREVQRHALALADGEAGFGGRPRCAGRGGLAAPGAENVNRDVDRGERGKTGPQPAPHDQGVDELAGPCRVTPRPRIMSTAEAWRLAMPPRTNGPFRGRSSHPASSRNVAIVQA
jgi:hypothetical protein